MSRKLTQDELIELLDGQYPGWEDRFMTPEAAVCYYGIEEQLDYDNDEPYTELQFND